MKEQVRRQDTSFADAWLKSGVSPQVQRLSSPSADGEGSSKKRPKSTAAFELDRELPKAFTFFEKQLAQTKRDVGKVLESGELA